MTGSSLGIDFARILNEFDTFLIGRKTFEAMVRMGNDAKEHRRPQGQSLLTVIVHDQPVQGA